MFCTLIGCSATTTAKGFFFFPLCLATFTTPVGASFHTVAIIIQPLLSGRPWPPLTQLHLTCHSCQLICINEWRSLLWRTAEWHGKWQPGVASGRVNLLKDAADQTAIHAYWLKRQEEVLHSFTFFQFWLKPTVDSQFIEHSPVAVTAFEWLCSSVLPEVSGELITSCKAPLAAFPWTPVGFLTWKHKTKDLKNKIHTSSKHDPQAAEMLLYKFRCIFLNVRDRFYKKPQRTSDFCVHCRWILMNVANTDRSDWSWSLNEDNLRVKHDRVQLRTKQIGRTTVGWREKQPCALRVLRSVVCSLE